MTSLCNQMLQLVVHAAEDKKASDIVLLDLRGICSVTDYFIICHGNSDTQVKAIVTEIRKKIQEAGLYLGAIEGMHRARWVLVDIGDIVVHVFHRDERVYYSLERLLLDAKRMDTV